MNKISIIVPVYNPPEECLKKCLDSLINQTFRDIEIILINNGASKNISNILNQFKNDYEKIILIKFEQNQGYSGACNEGLRVANGDYIQIVDSDDYLVPDAVEKIVNKLTKTNFPDMLFFCAAIYDYSTQTIDETSDIYMWKSIPSEFDDKIFCYNDVKDYIFKEMGEVWSKIYKKEFLKRTGNYFDNDLKTAYVDVLFNFKNYVTAKTISLLREKIYVYYRNMNSSVSSSLSRKNCEFVVNSILFAKKMEITLTENGIFEEMAFPFVDMVLKTFNNLFKNVIHKDNRKLFYDECHKFLKNANKKIFTPENINKTGLKRWTNKVKKYPYWLYCIL